MIIKKKIIPIGVGVVLLLLTPGPSLASPHYITKKQVRDFVHNTDPSLPNPASWFGVAMLPAFIIGLPICVMSTAFIKIMRDHRALTEKENQKLFLNCLFPIAGGLFFDDVLNRKTMKRKTIK